MYCMGNMVTMQSVVGAWLRLQILMPKHVNTVVSKKYVMGLVPNDVMTS